MPDRRRHNRNHDFKHDHSHITPALIFVRLQDSMEAEQTLRSWPGNVPASRAIPAYRAIDLRWQMYLAVFAVACLPLGLIWDISWHISIGRDTFWAPAHIVIQLGGLTPALLFAWQSLRVTFQGPASDRAATVSFWGARAPFGAWVTLWGALAMVASAPFDDWWHNTYGLDVKIASPPHALLGLGMLAVALGVLLSVLSWYNRAEKFEKSSAAWLSTLACGWVVTLVSVYATEFTWPNRQHTSNFYQVVSCLYPFLFVIAARTSKLPWTATRAALIYKVVMMMAIWILPLFPAQPMLAPIYNPVDRTAPPPFPMLLVVPALAIDLWLRRFDRRGRHRRQLSREAEDGVGETSGILRQARRELKAWFRALAIGVSFLALALAVQWYFAQFLLNPSAENWFFGGNRHWPYYVPPGEWMRQFWSLEADPVTLQGLAIAAGLAALSARLGYACSNWMLRVRR